MRLNLVRPLLKTKELSRLFRVKPRTILAWSAQGKLKPVRIGRQLLFRESDIAKLLRERRQLSRDVHAPATPARPT